MKRFVLVPLALLAFATSAYSQTAAAPKSDSAPTMTRSGPGQATSSTVVNLKAKVVAVDKATRHITLEGKDGKQQTFAVGPEVKRFDEIAVGDYVTLKYRQAVLLQSQPEGEKAAEPSAAVAAERAAADKAPGGVMAMQVRGTVTVTAVDQKTRTVVFETPKGELLKVKADKSINLKNVKAGQKFFGVYSEAVAIGLEKAKAPEKK